MSKLSNMKSFAQQVAEAIATVIDIEVTIIDDELIRIVGTGKYTSSIGQVLPPGSVSYQILKYGKMIFVDEPRKHPICAECSLKENCNEWAELCYPIIADGQTIGNLGLIAFNEKQKQELIANKQVLTNFLDNMASLIVSKASDFEKTSVIVGLKNQLEVIINNIDEGIVVFMGDKVSYLNDKAIDYFNYTVGIGSRLEETFADKQLVESLRRGDAQKQYIYTHGKEKYFIKSVALRNETAIDCDPTTLIVLRKVKDIQSTEFDVRKKLLNKGHVAKWTFDNMIYKTDAFLETIEEAKRYASSNSTVLIVGESGTGKELFAQSIHNFGRRSKGPFVAVNCAALPVNLLESELFGYAPGAFTGASKEGKVGMFELAHNGTIFLDEIGDMDLYLQSRLLRVLEQKEVMRLGDDRVIPIDVRVIAATNRNLYECVEKNVFRRDLFYRLNILGLQLPPLRERAGDIPALVDHFIEDYAKKYNLQAVNLGKKEREILLRYDWPGNVRELRALIEKLVVLSDMKKVDHDLLSSIIYNGKKSGRSAENSLSVRLELNGSFNDIQKQLIDATLDYSNRNLDMAAKLLGISKSTIWRRKNSN
jgi:transcriptional regulator with PAS, ATPase and Fis domain